MTGWEQVLRGLGVVLLMMAAACTSGGERTTGGSAERVEPIVYPHTMQPPLPINLSSVVMEMTQGGIEECRGMFSSELARSGRFIIDDSRAEGIVGATVSQFDIRERIGQDGWRVKVTFIVRLVDMQRRPVQEVAGIVDGIDISGASEQECARRALLRAMGKAILQMPMVVPAEPGDQY